MMRLRMGKFLASGGVPRGNSLIRAPLPGDLLIEFEVFRGVDHVQAAAQHRQGAAAVFQGPLVGGGVDAPGQSAHHRHSPGRQGPGQAPAGLQTIVGGAPGPHHRQGQVVLGQQGSLEEKKGRRIRNLFKAGREAGIVPAR